MLSFCRSDYGVWALQVVIQSTVKVQVQNQGNWLVKNFAFASTDIKSNWHDVILKNIATFSWLADKSVELQDLLRLRSRFRFKARRLLRTNPGAGGSLGSFVYYFFFFQKNHMTKIPLAPADIMLDTQDPSYLDARIDEFFKMFESKIHELSDKDFKVSDSILYFYIMYSLRSKLQVILTFLDT